MRLGRDPLGPRESGLGKANSSEKEERGGWRLRLRGVLLAFDTSCIVRREVPLRDCEAVVCAFFIIIGFNSHEQLIKNF